MQEGLKPMSDAVETYAGPLPWWAGISKTVQAATFLDEGQLLTKDEMQEAASLNWSVVSEPVMLGGDYPQVAKGYRAIRRKEDGTLFTIATDEYKITQPEVVFDLPQALIDDGTSAHFRTAGSLFGGKIVWSLLSLHEKEVLFDGDPSPYDLHLLTFTGNDGRHATTGAVNLGRVVCGNTWRSFLKGAKSEYKVRHTGNQAVKLGDMRTALKLTLAYKDRFVEVGNELFKVLISDADVDAFLETLLPVKEGVEHPWKTLAARAKIKDLYEHADDLRDLAPTGYRLVQAVGDYTDHFKGFGKGEFAEDRRALSTIEGSNYNLKTKAIGLLVPSAV